MDAVSKKEQVQVKGHLSAMAGSLEGEKEVRASLSAQLQSNQDGGGELGAADYLL
jgi:hypothetical protein